MQINTEVEIGWNGDIPYVETNNGDKIFKIPVEWIAADIVEVRANSLEEAIKIFMENENKIPLGKAPGFIFDSYHIASNAKDISQIAEDIKNIFDGEVSSEYEYE